MKKKVPILRRQFSKRLRMLRAARGYPTAREFSRALQIKEDRYTRWERAETEPDISNILGICRVLDTDPNELLLPLISRRVSSIKDEQL
jgi:transcriptional regulator with XRE-family HTH domain